MTKKKTPISPAAEANPDAISSAIAAGRALIDEGKTKVEASMAIYRLIESESQETIVKAFVEGAGLTDKGALTYWHNCRRRLARERIA